MECVVYVYVGMYSVCVYGIYGMCRLLGVGANICVSWGAVTVVCDMYMFVCHVMCVYDMCKNGMSDMVCRYVYMGA